MSELRQISINFNNCWWVDIVCHIRIFHLTSLMSAHYLVKHKSAKCLQNAQIITYCTEIHFIQPGVKVNGTIGTFYRDNFLAKKLLSDIFRISQGGVLSFNRTVYWCIEHVKSSPSWSER